MSLSVLLLASPELWVAKASAMNERCNGISKVSKKMAIGILNNWESATKGEELFGTELDTHKKALSQACVPKWMCCQSPNWVACTSTIIWVLYTKDLEHSRLLLKYSKGDVSVQGGEREEGRRETWKFNRDICKILGGSAPIFEAKKLGALVLPSVQDVLAVSFEEPSLYIQLNEFVEIIEMITDKLVGKRESN